MMRKFLKSVLCLMMIVAMLAAPISASAAPVARIMKSTGDFVRMYAGNGAMITRLRKGTKVLYWGEKRDQMLKVMLPSGQTGYVYQEYLSTYGAMSLNKLFITTKSTQMFNSSKKQIATLGSGRYVMVYKVSGGWAYVKTMSGTGGYVSTSALRRAF